MAEAPREVPVTVNVTLDEALTSVLNQLFERIERLEQRSGGVPHGELFDRDNEDRIYSLEEAVSAERGQ